MRADTQLDYAVFQLTPTRTRCELLVVAQGVTFKLASGLLKPFVSHLRVAEEQIAKGGYSIRLEPTDHSSATWFTKGTMERFVRFVSTPQVLERVSAVEMELSELEETIVNQKNNMADEKSALPDDVFTKMAPSPTSKGDKSMVSTNLQKPIKHGESLDFPESAAEGNAKQRLLRAIDARCLMLQKEQGMAFARALAAGFSIEHMDDLVSFSECFGASRLREACLKFIALCKKRQESGLWQEDLDLAAIEAARAGINVMRATGDMRPDLQGMLDEHRRASFPIEGKAFVGENMINVHTRRGSLDEISSQLLEGTSNMRSPGAMIDHSSPKWPNNGLERKNGEAEGITGLVSGRPFVGAWPGHLNPLSHEAMHPSFYGFPRPGMPYHQQGGNPYMQAAYGENSRWHVPASQYWQGNHSPNGIIDGAQHSGPRNAADRDSRGRNGGEGDDQDESFNGRDMEHSSSRKQSVSPRRKGHSSSNRSRMVVIRNINYITPSAPDHPDSGNNNGSDISGAYSENEVNYNGEEDNATENVNVKGVYDDGGNEFHTSPFLDRKRSNYNASSHHPVEIESKLHRLTGNSSKIYSKGGELMEEMLTLPERERPSRSGDMHSKMFIEQGKDDNKRTYESGDFFVIPDSRRSIPERSNVTLDVEFELSGKLSNGRSQEKFVDDSFIAFDQRATRQESILDWKAPLNLTSEMPTNRKTVDESKRDQKSEFLEPVDFFMKYERNKDAVNKSWNATVDYDTQVLAADMIEGSQRSQEHENVLVPSGDDENGHENVERGIESKEVTKGSERTKARPVQQIERRQSASARLGKPNPAQVRAEKLRDYKADLQRRKKEKEDEERKRIEDLRKQRQERIAARTSGSTSKSTPSSASPKTSTTTSLRGAMNGKTVTPLGAQNSIGNRPSRITENTLSQSVPSSLSEYQKKGAKTPVSGPEKSQPRSSLTTTVKKTPPPFKR